MTQSSASVNDYINNMFLQKLKKNELVSSMTIRLVKGIEICQIAKTAGFDSIYIDLEHCSFSLETTSQLCISSLQIGLAPFVRVPANSPEWISRVMDVGAMGVIAPHIRSAAEAAEVVKYAKFPPYGDRSSSGAMPHMSYKSIPASQLYPIMNQNSVVMVQFESQAALDNAESIIATEGVDIVLIGTNDLTADLGIAGQYDHPMVDQAYKLTIDLCKKYGKWCGVGGLSSRPDLVDKYVKLGARYVSAGTDLAFMLAITSEKANQIKKISY
jgi:2-keto-3-deoxy-L-rhamnonate aldolase RhmA